MDIPEDNTDSEDFGTEEEVESDEEIPLYIASNCSINRKKNSLNLISGQFPVNLSVPKWYWIPSILI